MTKAEAAEKPFGKLGHQCPAGCYNAGSAQLFASKKAPGEFECPSCGETFKAEPTTESDAKQKKVK